MARYRRSRDSIVRYVVDSRFAIKVRTHGAGLRDECSVTSVLCFGVQIIRDQKVERELRCYDRGEHEDKEGGEDTN